MLTIPVGQVQRVADALQSRLAPDIPITDALPVNDILVASLSPQVGPIKELVIYEVQATLSTFDEWLRLRPDQICFPRKGIEEREREL